MGMSETLGPRVYGKNRKWSFWGEKSASSGIIRTLLPKKLMPRCARLLILISRPKRQKKREKSGWK
jgi:hypothetical protein